MRKSPVLSGIQHTHEIARGYARIQRRYRPLSAELEARQATLSDRMDEIAEEIGHSEPEDGPLADEYRTIAGELECIEAQQYAFDPAELALAGGWLTIDEDGNLSTKLGYVKAEDVPLLDALRQVSHSPIKARGREDADETEGPDDGADEDRSSPLPSPASTTGLSDALLTDLHAARTVALRLEVAQRPDIALRLVAHSLAAQIVTHETTAARVSVSETSIPALAKAHCPDDEPLKARIGHWKLRLAGKAGQLWGAILALNDEDLLDLIAVCAAISIDATHSKFADFSNKQRMAHADQLATTLQLDRTRYWTATAEGFFSR